MLSVQPLEIPDFSGGITDNTFSMDLRKNERVDNLVLLSNKTPITRPGSIVDVITFGNGQIPAGAQRIGTFLNYNNSELLFVQSSKKIYYRNPSAYATVTGPTGNDVFSVGSTTSIVSHSEWNKQIYVTSDSFPRPMKIYKDQAGVVQVRTSSLPALATSPTVTIGAAGANNYIYAFHYAYSYNVGDQTFLDAGPITLLEVDSSTDPGTSANTVHGIPVLANGVTDNWDTTNIKIDIYRTSAGGTDEFLIGQVTNGTTTFVDNVPDATVIDGELIYTNDGTLDNDPAPLAKFVHVVNNIGYYAYIKQGSQLFPTKVISSTPFSPANCPNGFEDTVEDEITGLSSVQSIPIVLCKRKIYRVEGNFDQYGRGSMNHVCIHDTAGCVANQSLVQAENGLFWAGHDGFYYSDGYQCFKISDGNNENYKAMLAACTDQKRIYGKYDEKNRRICWGVQFNSSSFDNDALFILDLRYGISTDCTFTSWSGADSFRPSALEFFNGTLYRGDKRGYVFIHDDQYTTDPKVNTSADPSVWHTQPIIYNLTTLAFNFGNNFKRKWVTKVLLTAKNYTNVSIQINAINDDGKIRRSLKEIRWRRNFIWGDPDFTWGDPQCVWNSEGLIEQWRRMPARGLRLSYLQLEITNSYTVITNSDTIGKAYCNSTSKVITLDTAAVADWPVDCVGYFFSTAFDNYNHQFEIIARTDDTITVMDSGNQLPIGDQAWLIKGYRKNEILNLLGYTIHYSSMSMSEATYEAGQDGSNT